MTLRASAEPAELFQRLAGMMFDLLIQFCLVYFLLPPLLGLILPDQVRGYAVAASLFATIFLYEPVLVAAYGQTLGHRYRKIVVVDATNDGKIGFFRALVRFVLKTLLGLYSFISMLGSKRQTLHDHFTGSKVVKLV